MSDRPPVILSIDDDESIRELIDAILSTEGYRVEVAAGGAEGVRLFDAIDPDLVLLDVMMPQMDGYAVCDELQGRAHAAATPVVFLTALDSEQDRARAFACGAVGHLAKPFDRSGLLDIVGKHLETTAQWQSIVREAESWTERVVPTDFADFRVRLAERFDVGSVEHEAVMAAVPDSMYEAGSAIGLPEVEMAAAISEFLGLTYRPALDASSVVIDALPVAFCRKNLVVPMTDVGGLPVYVVANPFNWELLDLLERRSADDGLSLNLEIATPEAIGALFRYGGIEETTEKQTDLLVDEATSDMAVDPGDAEAAPVVFIANNVILSAVREGASDIHFEPKEDHMEIRFRIDGDMRDMLTLKTETAAMLISRLKALGQLDIAERRKPQDGSLETQIGGKRVKLRLATTSGPYGESMVIRLLDVSAEPLELEQLGFTTEQASTLYGFAERPHGMILIVGPTGSGKTTTIYSTLSSVDTERRSLMTVEDPVEYIIPRANHQQVNDKAGVSFESLLKSSVRQDPDVLFLGEIRDQFSARTALDFASTGHLTVSTLHTSNSTTAVFRLERLGVDRSIMADAILGVVAQRLVKRLCPHCRSVDPITPQERAQLEPFTHDIPDTVAHAVGCPKCRGGYSGRIGVQEIFTFDPEVASWIRDGVSIQDVRQRLADRGDYLIANSAIDKVRSHTISFEDAWNGVLVEEQARPVRTDAAPAPQPSLSTGIPAPPSQGWQPPAQGVVGMPSHTAVSQADDMLIGEREVAKRRTGESLIGMGAASRILVTDDDLDTREMIGRALTAEGYHVTFAEHGAAALALLRQQPFDLLLSDVTMPVMGGVELAEAVSREGMSVPIVMLTGVNDGEIEARALTLGVADYVSKPVRKDVLLLRVGRVIRSRI